MKKLFFLLLLTTAFACSEDDTTQPSDTFDRNAMLTYWADEIIIPGYTDFAEKTATLQAETEALTDNVTQDQLFKVLMAWNEAYLIWQRVAMFEIGKAEELALLNNLNIYPVDVNSLEENVNSGNYNLELPSTYDQQGFPAIDYILFGLASDQPALTVFLGENEAYVDYLQVVAARINSLAQTVLADWTTNYRATFIANDGNSATASVDRVVNDYIFYYEKHLRAGKVGIPAGVFSGAPLENTLEAYYSQYTAKSMLQAGLQAARNFFNGISFKGLNNGPGLADYLNELNAEKGGVALADIINDQFDATRNQIETMNENLEAQIATDNTVMLATFDQLQLNVVNLKVDMLQVLNINVDYVDADGD